MARLLAVALAVSAVWTLANAAVLLVADLPPGYPAIRYAAQIARWFAGNYLGCLTLAPAALFAYGHLRGGRLRWRRPAPWRRPFVRASLLALAAVAALAAAAAWVREDALGQAAQLSIWVPVVWLALRYGAPGAAVGGLGASVGVALTTPALNDPATLRAEILLAFVTSTVLLFGDRIAQLASLGRQARREASRLRGLARNAVALGEAQMRLASEAVDLVRETVRESEERVLDRFHAVWPEADGREFKRRNLMTLKHLYEVSDGLHSVTLRECGLVMALDIGSIWESLHTAGVAYACDTGRLDVAGLDEAMQATVYRLACEVASYLCANHGIYGLELVLRSGAYGGRRWVLLQARASLVPGISPRLHAALPHRLGGHGMGLRAIRDKAEIYEGALRVRRGEERMRLSVLLHPPGEERAAPPPGRRGRAASPFN
jgi:hypothetical protein